MIVSNWIRRVPNVPLAPLQCLCNSTKVTDPSQPQQKNPAVGSERNWIGPPDKLSNIRQVKYYIPEGESEAERTYRLMREDNDRFNHEFWRKHNASFIKTKEEFIEKKEQEKGSPLLHGDGTKHVLTAEEMSEFYRQFLNENQSKLKDYNKEWYKRNLKTLWLALRANIQRLFRRRGS